MAALQHHHGLRLQGINRIDEEDVGSQEASAVCDELLHEEVCPCCVGTVGRRTDRRDQ
jgi:hypothetical protein